MLYSIFELPKWIYNIRTMFLDQSSVSLSNREQVNFAKERKIFGGRNSQLTNKRWQFLTVRLFLVPAHFEQLSVASTMHEIVSPK